MTPTQPRRRMLAVGLLVIALGFLWLALVHPILGAFSDLTDDLEETRTLLVQYRAVAAERPVLEQKSQQVRQAENARAAYLGAISDGIAGATVQRMVKQAVERAGGDLQSTLILPVRPDDAFRRIAVRVQMTCTIEALRSALHAIEGNQPTLFIDGLEVRTRQNQRAANGKPAEDRTLDVRLDVYALALPPT